MSLLAIAARHASSTNTGKAFHDRRKSSVLGAVSNRREHSNKIFIPISGARNGTTNEAAIDGGLDSRHSRSTVEHVNSRSGRKGVVLQAPVMSNPSSNSAMFGEGCDAMLSSIKFKTLSPHASAKSSRSDRYVSPLSYISLVAGGCKEKDCSNNVEQPSINPARTSGRSILGKPSTRREISVAISKAASASEGLKGY